MSLAFTLEWFELSWGWKKMLSTGVPPRAAGVCDATSPNRKLKTSICASAVCNFGDKFPPIILWLIETLLRRPRQLHFSTIRKITVSTWWITVWHGTVSISSISHSTSNECNFALRHSTVSNDRFRFGKQLPCRGWLDRAEDVMLGVAKCGRRIKRQFQFVLALSGSLAFNSTIIYRVSH